MYDNLLGEAHVQPPPGQVKDRRCAADTREEAIHDLTLMLAYLTSWTERTDELPRFWKGYDFDVLNALDDQGLVSDSRRAKSAYLTEEGVERARRLLAQLGLPS